MHCLRTAFAGATECPPIENNRLEHDGHAGSYGRFAGHDLYFGHYGRDIHDAVSAGHAPITSFREPVSRIGSLYNYFKHFVAIPNLHEDPGRYAAIIAARRMTFSQFALSDDPEIRIYTRNQHFRQLTRSGWSLEAEGSLSQAIAFVDSMPFYYVHERHEASLRALEAFLGGAPLDFPRLNVTPPIGPVDEAPGIDPATRAKVLELNALDLALHDFAVRKLDDAEPRPERDN